MNAEKYYYDIAYHSLNKKNEELCGDIVEIFKTNDKTIIVLADGLGSGVKANILATMTSKIAGTMLKNGETIEETIHTILSTLPVCKERRIAYSTFGIIEIDHNTGLCKMIEYDNPPIFYIRNHKVLSIPKEVKNVHDKQVMYSEIVLEKNDHLTLVSDGVIHAGIGHTLNHGWEWEHVAAFLERQTDNTSEGVNRKLLGVCKKLYDGNPGDDTTAVTFKLREPEIVHLFTGPPEDATKDKEFVKWYYKQDGLKVVCGGTAAKIVGRELDKDVATSIEYYDEDVPPIAYINGIDLVTEGVLTIRKAIEKLEIFLKDESYIDFCEEDGATKLLDLLINHCTHLKVYLGKAINPAHQNPSFPIELSIKINIVEQFISLLKQIGIEVQVIEL